MYILLYSEFYAPTFTSAEILRAAELSPSHSGSSFPSARVIPRYIILCVSLMLRFPQTWCHILTSHVDLSIYQRTSFEHWHQWDRCSHIILPPKPLPRCESDSFCWSSIIHCSMLGFLSVRSGSIHEISGGLCTRVYQGGDTKKNKDITSKFFLRNILVD